MWRLRIPDLPKVRDAARTSGRSRHRLTLLSFTIASTLLLSACGSEQVAKAKSGYAYVGPGAVNLRKDLGPRAPMVDTAKHGEKLEVLETRRRFAKVRTPRGTEGWADANLLLTQQQVDDLERLAKSAAKLPSQGKASVYDVLNVHSEPSRPSPSFTQIPEGGTVEVLAHRVTLQAAAKPAAKVQAKPKSARASAKSKKEEKPKAAEDQTPPPPMPPAPKPPADWVARSIPRASALDAASSGAPAPKPVGDDWYLIRMADGRAGWVLARNLYMLIPDEVAQYAERKRITSYLSLGVAEDKDAKDPRHNWLWTTSATPLQPNVFDSFRVFMWSAKRNHYETAFIERNVKGYYPIETVDLPDKTEKGFSVVIEEKDGQLYKRVYGFSGYRIRMISKTPYQPPPELPMVSESRSFEPPPEPEKPDTGVLDRVRGWFR